MNKVMVMFRCLVLIMFIVDNLVSRQAMRKEPSMRNQYLREEAKGENIMVMMW